MPSSSIFKFMGRADGNGRGEVHWGRGDIDGAPFRGANAPLLTSEEAEDRLVKTFDPFNRIFDLSDPEQNKAYIDVCDRILNGWARLITRKHMYLRTRRVAIDKDTQEKTIASSVRVQVYMEWAEPYMEDGQPMLAQRPYLGRPND